ncbi:cell division control protein 48 homolog C isoform X2 [Dendrobium catenatum]|uniref:cell division control protein 48 homolog C isoform X2 n=1 Tax=Dendrobium catenatum TaxID=906689 RepID=UPI0009F170DC|nr:cell division control protein 48 homolog C isoform X2 [Dendrobium catenatum]
MVILGASEKSICDLFNKACQIAPSIIFIDDIDVIASKRENLQREMKRRIMMQLMTCMDESQQILRVMDSDYGQEAYEKIIDRMSSYVLVIGATSRPDAIDQALRKPGRFDRDIALGVTDVDARTKILSVLTRNVRIEGKFDRFKIDRLTPDFVGADLARLVSKARNLAIKRIIDKRPQLGENVDWWRHLWLPEEIENLSITMFNFELLIKLDGVDQRHSVYVIGATNSKGITMRPCHRTSEQHKT